MKIPDPIIVPTIKFTPPMKPTRLFNSTVVSDEPEHIGKTIINIRCIKKQASVYDSL